MDKTGMGASDIARAYLIVRDSFDLRGLWARIDALDARLPVAVQLQMMILVRRLIDRATGWLLRQGVDMPADRRQEIGRATCRERVSQLFYITVITGSILKKT